MSDNSLDDAPAAPRSAPQLTFRAVASGMAFGGLLSLCNIYTGLKIGWSTNMSITAGLLSFAFWKAGQMLGARPYGILENNINQTSASAGASVSSAGLVAPIPALTLLTGQTLSWVQLSVWILSVTCVGIVAAIAVRRQMMDVDKLPFPLGVATAGTLREMYARGSEAMARVAALGLGAAAAGALKIAKEVWSLPKVGSTAALSLKGAVPSVTLKNLSFALDPSLLMVGVGGIIGMRACVSMLIGAVVTWGLLAPYALEQGWAEAGKPEPDAVWFGALVKWLLWPGVAMMVTSALTGVAMSAGSVLRALGIKKKRSEASTEEADASAPATGAIAQDTDVPRRVLLYAVVAAAVFSVFCQVFFFDISAPVALFGVLLTFVLAIVAARVSGETGITPVGAMGKVTQLTFGVVAPASVTSNLMAANVTGGAASQCADLLHDLKTGRMLGAWTRHQAVAQFFGVIAGSFAGSAAYLVLIPNPQAQLLTDQWPAPAVAQWKAVAEVFAEGISSMPPGSLEAMAIAGVLGVLLTVSERKLPKRAALLVPSAGAVGLAMIIPAYISIAMFFGGLAAWIAARVAPEWAARFVIAIAAGLVAGESLTGVGVAIQKMLAG